MAKLRVTIIDEVKNRRLKVDLPDDAAIEKLLPALAKKLGLPPAAYQLTHEATEQALGGDQTLASFGVSKGDALRLAAAREEVPAFPRLAVEPVDFAEVEAIPIWQRVPVWGWVGIVVVVLMAVAVLAFLAGRGARQEPTPTAIAQATTPTPTSAAVPQPTATPVAPTSTPLLPTDTPVPPTATPVPTSTPRPTATPVPPTNTPVPTATPQPTPTGCPAQPQAEATLEAVQETTAALVPGAKVIWYDSFECSDLSYGWNIRRSGLGTIIKVSNGMVRISAQKADDVWVDGIYRATRSIQDGQGVLVLFRYETGVVGYPMFIEVGEHKKSNYRGWGLMISDDPTDAYPGQRWDGWEGIPYVGEPLATTLRPGEWHYLLMQLGKNGELICRVWERNDPSRQTELRKVRNANWIGLQWRPHVTVHSGVVEIDEYQELEFASP